MKIKNAIIVTLTLLTFGVCFANRYQQEFHNESENMANSNSVCNAIKKNHPWYSAPSTLKKGVIVEGEIQFQDALELVGADTNMGPGDLNTCIFGGIAIPRDQTVYYRCQCVPSIEGLDETGFSASDRDVPLRDTNFPPCAEALRN